MEQLMSIKIPQVRIAAIQEEFLNPRPHDYEQKC
jgi:hypothetical protein